MNTQFRPYALVTVRVNRMGHIEMWKGKGSQGAAPADVYLQVDTDVSALLESLPSSQREDAVNGWAVRTHFVSDEYFTQ